MTKLDLMNDEQVIKWIKQRIASICIIMITLVLFIYSRVVNRLNPSLLDKFVIIAIFIFLISILCVKFFLDKIIFNMDNKKKAYMVKSIRAKYNKK